MVLSIPAVLEALAIPGLMKRKMAGGNFLYYAVWVGAVSSLFNYDIVGLIVSALIGNLYKWIPAFARMTMITDLFNTLVLLIFYSAWPTMILEVATGADGNIFGAGEVEVANFFGRMADGLL